MSSCDAIDRLDLTKEKFTLARTLWVNLEAVAITPDGKLAVVGAPSRWDEAAGKEVLDTFLQVVDLEATPPKVIGRVELGAHPSARLPTIETSPIVILKS